MKIFIIINFLVFLFYGLGFIFFPELLSMHITDTVPDTTSGMIDMRATYGGMSIGLAILLGVISRNTQLFTIGTKAITFIVGGMAIGRTIGIIQDGSPNTMMYIYLAVEIIVVVIGVALILKSHKK